MPVLAAGASIFIGAGMVATAPLWGGLMIAGGVMAGIGYLTDNKKLQNIGMVAGLAGGVGGWAAGAFNASGQAAAGAGKTGAGAAGSQAGAQTGTGAGAISEVATAPTVAGELAGTNLGVSGVAPEWSAALAGTSAPSITAPVATEAAKTGGGGMIASLMPKTDTGKIMFGQALAGGAEGYFADDTAKRQERIAQQQVDINRDSLEFDKMRDARAYENYQVPEFVSERIPGIDETAEAFDKEQWAWREKWQKAYSATEPAPAVRPG